MIIYNVTVKVSHGIVATWKPWMQEEHIPEVLATGMFVSYRMCKLEEVTDDEGETYVIQYDCLSEEDYQNYLLNFSAQLQQKSYQKFGSLFIAFRTKMSVIHHG